MRKRTFPLRRGGRTAVNFTLSVLVLLYFWGAAAYPLPTAEMEFRRMEQNQLLRPSRTVRTFSAGGNRWFWSAEHGVLHLWRVGEERIRSYDLSDGGVLLPLTDYVAVSDEVFFLAAGVPEEAVRAESTFEWSGSGPVAGYRFHAPGRRLEGSGFLFRVDGKKDSGSEITAGARFYDSQDQEVARLVFG